MLAINLSSTLNVVGMQSIDISYGDNKVNSLQATYLLSDGSHIEGPMHGKVSGSSTSFSLGPGEYIMKVEGQTNQDSVYQLTFTTAGLKYTTKAYGPFGGSAGRLSFSFQNAYIVGFHGRSGDRLYSIGVHSLPLLGNSGMLGYAEGGTEFDDKADSRIPPIIGINRINVWHGDYIYAIQIEYLLLGNTTLLTSKYGSDRGNLSTVQFRTKEIELLQGIDVCAVDDSIRGMEFYTLGNPRYIEFGSHDACSIILSIHGMIAGFFGRFKDTLINLGIYFADDL